jgi:hypothetical protein
MYTDPYNSPITNLFPFSDMAPKNSKNIAELKILLKKNYAQINAVMRIRLTCGPIMAYWRSGGTFSRYALESRVMRSQRLLKERARIGKAGGRDDLKTILKSSRVY